MSKFGELKDGVDKTVKDWGLVRLVGKRNKDEDLTVCNDLL